MKDLERCTADQKRISRHLANGDLGGGQKVASCIVQRDGGIQVTTDQSRWSSTVTCDVDRISLSANRRFENVRIPQIRTFFSAIRTETNILF